MTLRQVIDAAEAALAEAGVASPRADAELLAAHAAGTDRGRLALTRPDAAFVDRYHGLIARRANRVPLQHITGNAAFVVHPPLGKWIIALGMMVLGPDSGWGWRITTALLGTAAVLVLMLIAKRLSTSTTFAVVAGLLMAVDGLAISMSRVALLDTSLTFFARMSDVNGFCRNPSSAPRPRWETSSSV